MGSVSIKSVLSQAFAFGLASFALTASAAPTAKAVYEAEAKTLTFYYDDLSHEEDGFEVFAITSGTRSWESVKTTAKSLVFDSSFKAFRPTTCKEWFYGFSALSYISGLDNLDTSDVTSMYKMFSGLSSSASPRVTVLDLSSFDTAKVTSFEQMFGYTSLVTIYVSDLFAVSSTAKTGKMFINSKSLVGGAGTKYNDSFQDATYARIDNPPDAPGYFTSINHPPIIGSVKVSEVTFESAKVTVSGADLDGGTITVEAISGEETEVTKVAADFGTVTLDGLAADTEYTVKVTAANDHGSRIAEGGPFTTLPLPLPTISSVTVNGVSHDTVVLTVAGESIADVEVKVDLIEGGEIRATKTEDAFGEFVFEGLTPETTYAVKVTATNQYGPSVDESTSFTTLEKPADEWKVVWDETGKAGTLSWGKWKFNVTLAKDGTLAVGLVTAWPDSVYPLDFSLPVKDGDGADYVISSLDTRFGFFDTNNKYTPTAYPQAAMVGLLTLPGEGLVKILGCAFMGCAAATGHLEFPSTLTDIGDGAFWHCTTLEIDCGTIPVGVSAIPQYCFSEDACAYGDAVLPNVKSVGQAAFRGTGITSVSFGSGLMVISGNNDRGAFQGCTSLTNVMFDATAKVQMTSARTFYGCTGLEVLDLSPVVNMALVSDRNDYSHISGCSKLKKIIFGAGLTNLMCNAIAGATALEEIVFEGVPPVGFGMPYLSAKNSKGEHDACYDKQKVTTYVHRKLVNEKNEAGMCWADYAANGQIGAARKDPARNTTWAADYVYEGVDLAKRQLLTIEPGTGLMLLVR